MPKSYEVGLRRRRRATANKPVSPEPNSHTAAGTGISEVGVALGVGSGLRIIVDVAVGDGDSLADAVGDGTMIKVGDGSITVGDGSITIVGVGEGSRVGHFSAANCVLLPVNSKPMSPTKSPHSIGWGNKENASEKDKIAILSSTTVSAPYHT